MHKDDWEIAESLFHSEIAMINGDDNLIDVENIDVENIVYQNGTRIKDKHGNLVTKKTIESTIQKNKESKALRKSQREAQEKKREAQEKKRKAKRRDYDEDEENNTSSSFVASDVFRSPVRSSSPVGRFNNLRIGSPNRTPTNRTPVYSPSAYQSPSDLMQGYESTRSTPSSSKKARTKITFNGGKNKKTKKVKKSKSKYTKKRNMKKQKK